MVSAGTAPLPEATLLACKHRILDTFGAMVSGARMRPGQMAAKYVRGLGRKPQVRISVNVTADFGNVTDSARLGVARFRL
jgi:2-methylcitrate dehydratase PrpD